MEHYVYIVECRDKSYYTGITWNIEKRIKEHNEALSIATKGKLPVKLVYWEKLNDKFSAAKREKEIKGWSRMKKQALIAKLTLNEVEFTLNEVEFTLNEVEFTLNEVESLRRTK